MSDARKLLLKKAKAYREGLKVKEAEVTLMRSEVSHLLSLLSDSADILEAYSEYEDFSHEIRETVKKITKESGNE